MPAQDTAMDVLVSRLFMPRERWGWEFVDPGSARPSPALQHEPRWVEPPPPDLREIEWRREKAKKNLWPKIIGVVLLVLIGLGSLDGVGLLLVLVAGGLGYWFFEPIVLAGRKIASARDEAAARRRQAVERFERQHEDWRSKVIADDRSEQTRLATQPRHFPLQVQGRPSRVDVFGGTAAGWAALLTTAGSAAIASGRRMLVLDFTQEDITFELSELAARAEHVVRRDVLPQDLPQLKLLEGMSADELGAVLAQGAYLRCKTDQHERRAAGADLLRHVAGALDGDLSFPRLTAGLRMLQRAYRVGVDHELTPEEEHRLAERIDLVGEGEDVRKELRFLVGALSRLAHLEMLGIDEPRDRAAAPETDLTVLATAPDHDEDRRALMDAVLFHTVLHQVRQASSQVAGRLVVVAGADHMGKEALELMAHQARRHGVQLVYLLERLRDDLRELLGGDNSATVLMRLGNQSEAEQAATFIGRSHKYVLGQITRGAGITDTDGGGTSVGGSESIAETDSVNWSRAFSSQGFFSRKTTTDGTGGGRSVTKTWAENWTENETWSTARATNHGTIDTRVYEFDVEPTVLQSLPTTAFVLVDTGPGGRRVRIGDAHPGYCLLDLVADTPREVTSPDPYPIGTGQGGTASPPGQHEGVRTWMHITDPVGEHVPLADRLRGLGYTVSFQQPGPGGPSVGGWSVSRSDGRPLDSIDNRRINDALGSHAAPRR